MADVTRPILLVAAGLSACTPSSNPPIKAQPVDAGAASAAPKSIGAARMLADGTITLQLRAEDPASGAIGDAFFTYPPTHPEYQKILEHLGPMKPGDQRPVPPWPEKK
jgi:hypothetical protein